MARRYSTGELTCGQQINPIVYRDGLSEDASGIHYTKKTGNVFTDDKTFSVKTAKQWIAQGYTVIEVDDWTGEILRVANYGNTWAMLH